MMRGFGWRRLIAALGHAGVVTGIACGAAQSVSAQTTTYTYDVLGRLVAVDTPPTPAGDYATTYSYDAASNRTNVTVTGGPVVSTCFYSIADNLAGVAGNPMAFTVSRTGNVCSANVDVNYQVFPGTALVGTHYYSQPSALEFGSDGPSNRSINIPTIAGSVETPVEFTIQITVDHNGNEGAVTDGTALGRISATAPAEPCTITGGGGGVAGNPIPATIYRTGSCPTNQTVQFTTRDYEALAGVHYVATSGTFTFSGTTSVSANIPTIADSIPSGGYLFIYLDLTISEPDVVLTTPIRVYVRNADA